MNTDRVKVEIITIGDEILIGQIVDTNSAWMATELNKCGFELAQITSIHDDERHIIESLDLALGRADIVLFTGGIGPTNDDITKQTLAKYFDTRLVFDESVLDNIKQLFSNRPNYGLNDLNRSQAMVPENCTVIQNKVGTAPITWFEKDGKVIVSMPGVPYEMKQVMTSEIIPRLQNHYSAPVLIHKTVQVYGYPESALAIKIADWEKELPAYIHLAYLPNSGVVKLRLSGQLDDVLALQFSINQQVDKLSQLLGKAIVAYEDVSISNLVGDLLKSKGLMVATAESCTGGNIAHELTLIPGSSEFFKGSVVAYSNDIKTGVLQVSSTDLENDGAVSKSVVEQMAEGARKLLRSDVSIATSGIAGPSGGTAEKPVGTVWIAVSSEDKTISREFKFGSLREQNIIRATQAALLMLKEIL
ncbi:competence/damage-inducible protein cinA [Paludibacter propionicigenes WB4]|uniref:CinA-like protein n=1 Tax=Paludibacter propionicigenes (strain DSM 17365 / JCM 13257 / WB4) TaxID=694427 RepID=E4T3M9_PALPW|nr:competence/damage-inducible protein A [Paludibacter propionicigenes]ADQ79323.1 competence/damage-inducible protein cinA [Paludibacter propionicigenes WB4]